MLSMLVLASVLAAAEPAPPETRAAPTQAAAPASRALKPGQRKVKMVCKTEVDTGTRFGKRVCMSAEDLERQASESQNGFSEMQRNHNVFYSKND